MTAFLITMLVLYSAALIIRLIIIGCIDHPVETKTSMGTSIVVALTYIGMIFWIAILLYIK